MISVDLKEGALNSKVILNVEAPIAQWNLKRTLPTSSKYLLAMWPGKLCYGAHRCHSSQLQARTVTSALQIRDLSTRRHRFPQKYLFYMFSIFFEAGFCFVEKLSQNYNCLYTIFVRFFKFFAMYFIIKINFSLSLSKN